MKFAVIGGGSIGKRHIGNLLETGVAPRDIAVVDPRSDRRDEVVSRFGVTSAYEAPEALYELDLTGVLICSPTSMHIRQAIPFAERGIHLLIEKPLDAELKGADKLAATVEKTGARVLIAYCFRFSEHARKLKMLVDQEVVGKALFVRGEFSEFLPDWHPWEDYRSFYMAKRTGGGGSLLDQSHIMDIAHWLFGDVSDVFAMNGNLSDLEVETDDFAEMMIRFQSGMVGVIHQDMFGRKHTKCMDVKCEHGNIFWDVYDLSVSVYDARTRTTTIHSTPKDHQIMYRNEIRHFLSLCRGEETRAGCSLDEGIHGMKIIEAARRSQNSGRLEAI